MVSSLTMDMGNQLDIFDKKIKNSFSLIKRDVNEMGQKLDSMKSYMNDWDSKISKDLRDDHVLRDSMRVHLNDFSDKVSKIRDVLSSVNAMRKQILVVDDLKAIEEKMVLLAKREVNDYKNEIISLRAALSTLNARLDNAEKRRLKREYSSKKLNESKKKGNHWSFTSSFPQW